jgi:hypothetical protein
MQQWAQQQMHCIVQPSARCSLEGPFAVLLPSQPGTSAHTPSNTQRTATILSTHYSSQGSCTIGPILQVRIEGDATSKYAHHSGSPHVAFLSACVGCAVQQSCSASGRMHNEGLVPSLPMAAAGGCSAEPPTGAEPSSPPTLAPPLPINTCKPSNSRLSGSKASRASRPLLHAPRC